MSGTLVIRSRQRVRRVDTRLLRRLARHLLREEFETTDFELCVHLVGTDEITRLNGHFLRHDGPTDIITFDQSDGTRPRLAGELFICVDEAVAQARRFRTTWQSELARYVIHGLLHLRGFDDRDAHARRRMKREEGRLLRRATREFPIAKLHRA